MKTATLDRRYNRQVILNVKPQKYNFLVELLKNFDFVKITEEKDGDSREEIIANLQQAARDLKLLKEGKLKTRPARELLKEL